MEDRVIKQVTHLPPNLADKCVIPESPEKWKTAALLFDKIWIFHGNLYKESYEVPDSLVFSIRDVEEKLPYNFYGGAIRLLQHDKKGLLPSELGPEGRAYAKKFSRHNLRYVSEKYAEKGINAIPLYDNDESFNQEWHTGESLVFQAILNNVELVHDRKITWEQVIEFRKDQQALNRYRRLKLWINDTLKGKSLSEASDILSITLQDYNWAIKKHGFETKNGLLNIVFGSDFVKSLAGGAGISILTGSAIWGAIGAGSIMLGKAATYLKERQLNLKELKHGKDSNIAIVHDLKEAFGK